MGTKRVGLARTQKLIEGLKRELILNSTLKAAKKETITVTATSKTLTAADSGATVILAGGSASTVTLPAATDGAYFEFFAQSAQAHVVQAASNILQGAVYDNSNTASGGSIARTAINDGTSITIANGAVGDSLSVVSDGTNWYVKGWLNDTPTVA